VLGVYQGCNRGVFGEALGVPYWCLIGVFIGVYYTTHLSARTLHILSFMYTSSARLFRSTAWWCVRMLAASSGFAASSDVPASWQGLTLVHLSAQLEPYLSQGNTLHTLNTP
jgi:hypothetical protein